MTIFPLHHLNSHLFLELDDGLWLHDTGAPSSFGRRRSIELLGQAFAAEESYMGLDAALLSEAVGIECRGLLGADILGTFDQIIDLPNARLTLAEEDLEHRGHLIRLDDFMGIPIISATVADEPFRMFFDTGAQISYLQDDVIESFPASGAMDDFYPGFGQFVTETHLARFVIGGETQALRCGRLPGLLGMSLMMADVQGILGNAILEGRSVGYFPRRKLLSR
jgi:hypothetical protein